MHIFLWSHILAELSEHIKTYITRLVDNSEACAFAKDLAEVASGHFTNLNTFAIFYYQVPVRSQHFKLVLKSFFHNYLFYYF